MRDTEVIRLGCRAMGTAFEVALWGGSRPYLEAAAEEALGEIQRLDRQLSFFRSDSDIRELNAFAAEAPIPVDPRLFRLLERCAALSAETEGAFDITIAPLLRAWGFVGASGSLPDDAEVQAAREITGMSLVELDPEQFTVRFLRPGVMIDLGAVGKGFAIERASELLREAGVGGALIHGGSSSIQAVGAQPDGFPWAIAVRDPTSADRALGVIPLRDRSLSVSAVHGKSFAEGDIRYGHVLDPRAGRPVQGALLAAVTSESATDGDALSTALLVLGESFLPRLSKRANPCGGLVALPEDGGLRLEIEGIEGWLPAEGTHGETEKS